MSLENSERRLARYVVESSSGRHAGLENRSCTILSLHVRGSGSMVPVVGGPIELVVAVSFVNGVLRLIPRGVNECK